MKTNRCIDCGKRITKHDVENYLAYIGDGDDELDIGIYCIECLESIIRDCEKIFDYHQPRPEPTVGERFGRLPKRSFSSN